MIACGIVPVGHPVDADGRATSQWGAMVGVAGRGGPDRVVWRDGDEYPLISNKECLIVLSEPMEVVISGTAHRLGGRESHYVVIRNGKIVDVPKLHHHR